MMVPMADILNHVANHNANLEFTAVSGQGRGVLRVIVIHQGNGGAPASP